MRRISEASPLSTPVLDTDELPARRGGSSGRITVGAIRAPLAPASHTHAIGDVTGLQTALDGKAAVGHTHAIGDVTGLQTALDGKAAVGHTHAISDVTGLQTALDGKAAVGHTHAISDVTGLQTALDGKAPISHTHTEADITGTIGPGKIAQAGATTGQVLKWNGTAWAPGNDATGSGVPPGGTTGQVLAKASNADGDTTWVTPTGGGGDPFAAPFIHLPGSVFTAPVIDGVGRQLISGTGATTFAANSSTLPAGLLDTSIGWITHDKGTQALGRAHALLGFPTGGTDGRFLRPTTGSRVVFEVFAAVSALPDSNDNFIPNFGFIGDPFNIANCYGVFFWADANSPNWIARARSGGGGPMTNTDTNVALAANTPFRLRIEWSTAQAVFKINGAAVATITTNLPTDRCFGACGISGVSGTNNRSVYWSHWVVRREAV